MQGEVGVGSGAKASHARGAPTAAEGVQGEVGGGGEHKEEEEQVAVTGMQGEVGVGGAARSRTPCPAWRSCWRRGRGRGWGRAQGRGAGAGVGPGARKRGAIRSRQWKMPQPLDGSLRAHCATSPGARSLPHPARGASAPSTPSPPHTPSAGQPQPSPLFSPTPPGTSKQAAPPVRPPSPSQVLSLHSHMLVFLPMLMRQ